MNWINPPRSLARFTALQIAQHWVAAAAALFLAATGLVAFFPASTSVKMLHARGGVFGAGVLLFHACALVAIAIRHNVAPEKVAFLPTAEERRALRRQGTDGFTAGKYAPEEKGDYLCILGWSLLVAATGLCLRWPARLGVPGPSAFGWVKAAHAACGAGLAVHLLAVHVPERWLSAAPLLRKAIFTGKVPVEVAEARAGWVADLVASGLLVPAPEQAAAEDARETRQVRDLLENGNLLVKAGRYAEACAVFESALELLPSYSQARFNLAVARMREGKPELAAREFREFIAADPFNPMAERAKELLAEISGGAGGGAD